jgi:D-alanyl-D-alanine carboxypeptidase/D-alanyl-D-alanine-endopeptidase (penicillin-binding protein 4)
VRRWLGPAILVLVSLNLAVLAGGWSPTAAQAALEPAKPSPAAPLLSARRIPALLSRIVGDDRYSKTLGSVFTDPIYGSGITSCLVVRHGGQTIYSQSSATPMIPASNIKLLTATAILKTFAPTERLKTDVRTTGAVTAGVLDGNLWIVGGGDPLIETNDYAAFNSKVFHDKPHIHSSYEHLADLIVATGIKEVKGSVVGDESRYDRQRYVPSWRPIYVSDGEAGPASSIEVNDGFRIFEPKPVAVAAPATHAAELMTALLAQRGVKVDGPAAEGATPAGTRVVTSLPSVTISDMVTEMLQESDNMTAELMVKELGLRKAGGGTTDAGLRVVSTVLQGMGLPLTGYVAHDGSGLDRGDRATCALLMAALAAAGPDSQLARSLSVAGQSGTLVNRFVGTPIAGHLRAKTGSLDFVVALSGFLDNGTSVPVTFAMIANGLPKPGVISRHLQDQLVQVLATKPTAPPVDKIAP